MPFDKRFRLPLHSLPFVCLAGFLLASMAVAAVFRSGMGDYIPSRYLVYPHLLIALVCILAMIKLKDKKVAMPVAILFTLLMLVTYNMNFRGGLKDFARLKDTLKNTDYYYPHKEAAKDVANRACQAKIYCIEDNR